MKIQHNNEMFPGTNNELYDLEMEDVDNWVAVTQDLAAQGAFEERSEVLPTCLAITTLPAGIPISVEYRIGKSKGYMKLHSVSRNPDNCCLLYEDELIGIEKTGFSSKALDEFVLECVEDRLPPVINIKQLLKACKDTKHPAHLSLSANIKWSEAQEISIKYWFVLCATAWTDRWLEEGQFEKAFTTAKAKCMASGEPVMIYEELMESDSIHLEFQSSDKLFSDAQDTYLYNYAVYEEPVESDWQLPFIPLCPAYTQGAEAYLLAFANVSQLDEKGKPEIGENNKPLLQREFPGYGFEIITPFAGTLYTPYGCASMPEDCAGFSYKAPLSFNSCHKGLLDWNENLEKPFQLITARLREATHDCNGYIAADETAVMVTSSESKMFQIGGSYAVNNLFRQDFDVKNLSNWIKK